MEQEQVITIHQDGSISGLQRKDGLDLRQFGKCKISRASEIVWTEDKQLWRVQFMNGPIKFLTTKIFLEAGCKEAEGITLGQGFVYFKEYDDAVKAEIQVLDYLRLQGINY